LVVVFFVTVVIGCCYSSTKLDTWNGSLVSSTNADVEVVNNNLLQ
jgi:hypothetical protein